MKERKEPEKAFFMKRKKHSSGKAAILQKIDQQETTEKTSDRPRKHLHGLLCLSSS